MKYSRKMLMLYSLSIVLFAIAMVLFLYMFCFAQTNVWFYFCSFSLLIICALLYYYSNKKMMCDDGYTWMQAYFFYVKCKKNGVYPDPHKLTPKDTVIIRKFAKQNDFSRNFKTTQLKKMFEVGYEISQII